MLAAVVVGFLLVRSAPVWIFGFAFGALLVAVCVWVLVSVLWPARADRVCPRCGRAALERADPATTVGLVCRACGHRDETRSAWTLAEEEGPLEELVLATRRARRTARARPRGASGAPSAKVDLPAPASYEGALEAEGPSRAHRP